MAHPYVPVRTEDVPLDHTGDVSPMEETATPLRQTSAAPHEETPEKTTAVISTDESLKSQSSTQTLAYYSENN
jgi:hypothetical protein